MRTRSFRAVAAALLLALGLYPLSSQAKVRHQPLETPDAPIPLGEPEPTFPLDVAWTLFEINGKPPGGDPPSFTLDDKLRATGFSGCNTYSMTLFPIRGQKLAAGTIAMTRKPCATNVMVVERTFLVALHSLPVWSMNGSDLMIKSGPTLLRFRRGF